MDEFVFKLPDLGEGVVEGEIVAWHVSVGHAIVEDDPLVDVMTDKATVTISSVVTGKVVSLNGRVGETIAVGCELSKIDTTLVTPSIKIARGTQNSLKNRSASASSLVERSTASKQTGTDSGQVTAQSTALSTAVSLPATAAESAKSPVESLANRVSATAAKPLASPAVRRRAREKGLDLQEIVGTGRNGRITDADLESHQRLSEIKLDESFVNAARPTIEPVNQMPLNETPYGELPPGVESVAGPLEDGTMEFPLTALRRRIAQKMTVSARHIPHFSYVEQIDITELAELRKFLNERGGADSPKLTYLPFFMLALARSLRVHPHLNAQFDEARNVVTRHDAVHLGIATQTDRGLYVPVVRNVQEMSLWEARAELRRVVAATQQYTIKREELIGSTCTVSSLGPYGGIAATPIINHPEIAILGINKAEDRPVVRDGQIVIRHIVNVSASFDHRVVDGADGIALIQTLKGLLEHPATMFI